VGISRREERLALQQCNLFLHDSQNILGFRQNKARSDGLVIGGDYSGDEYI
jgi:hypothetical protein